MLGPGGSDDGVLCGRGTQTAGRHAGNPVSGIEYFVLTVAVLGSSSWEQFLGALCWVGLAMRKKY